MSIDTPSVLMHVDLTIDNGTVNGWPDHKRVELEWVATGYSEGTMIFESHEINEIYSTAKLLMQFTCSQCSHGPKGLGCSKYCLVRIMERKLDI